MPASYKSGRYQKWQEQKKIGYDGDNDDEDGEDEQPKRKFNSGTRQFGGKNGKGMNHGKFFKILNKIISFSSNR